MTKQEREEMSDLSKFVFGTRRAWKKILEQGMLDVQTRTVTETVPGNDGEPDTTRQVQVAVTASNGKPIKVSRHFTEFQLLEYMVQRKTQFEDMIKNFQQQQAAQAAANKAAADKKELEDRIHDHASGSSL